MGKETCSQCGNKFISGLAFCPFCFSPRVKIKKIGNFVVIYRPPSESFAYLSKGLVEAEGITTFLHSYQIAMYDDVGTMMEGAWGELLVPESLLEKALSLFQSFSFEEKPEESSEDSS
jgi:uncharacterized OB-fold protein